MQSHKSTTNTSGRWRWRRWGSDISSGSGDGGSSSGERTRARESAPAPAPAATHPREPLFRLETRGGRSAAAAPAHRRQQQRRRRRRRRWRWGRRRRRAAPRTRTRTRARTWRGCWRQYWHRDEIGLRGRGFEQRLDEGRWCRHVVSLFPSTFSSLFSFSFFFAQSSGGPLALALPPHVRDGRPVRELRCHVPRVESHVRRARTAARGKKTVHSVRSAQHAQTTNDQARCSQPRFSETATSAARSSI